MNNSNFTWTDEEVKLLDQAIINGGEIWNNKNIKICKDRFKDVFINIDGARCCYCARLFNGEFKMVVDIEHILPKGTYPSLIFNVSNLSLACKRCNMKIKGTSTDFIKNHVLSVDNYFRSESYKFIHPNIDSYFDHLGLRRVECDGRSYIKYIPKNESKGKYTYSYFNLKEIEIDTFNYAQGSDQSSKLSLKFKGLIKKGLLIALDKM